MLSERLQLKLFLEPSAHFELEPLIPVFHRFIREQVIKELMIDVVDYSHVPNGPGVVLIGHSADYYVGALDGAYGLVYSLKRGGPGAEARLEDSLRRVVNVARLLEQSLEPWCNVCEMHEARSGSGSRPAPHQGSRLCSRSSADRRPRTASRTEPCRG